MKIAIIGAGAMGSLYGGYLSKVAKEVYLVDIWQEHIEAINKSGLKIEEADKDIVVHPKAVTTAETVGHVDLAIIFVKSIMTGMALEKNSALLGPDTMVLSLQNGYGNIDQICKYVKIDNVIAGTTAHGATMLAPAHIKHGGTGETHIGLVVKKEDKRIHNIAKLLREAGFSTIISDNVMELIWSKLIINVGINALTAIFKVENGKLLKFEETKDLMTMAVKEAVKVAKASGIIFDEEAMIKKVMEVTYNTSENKSSMLQDILNKRKTEIDTINGAIVKEGEKYLISTPVNLVLTNMIKSLEKGI
ncbi:2-dehydropantoate 2-reductase [Clostridium sp. A1-XYC3]|uniref:2-dehydropantoate 2-reductase n=1 Tax=Clostridium tanneri TaxID=3037988 RepID=A0ABU4JQ80_9CLOT|nr:2-dehydropantoate 2-reductase [Clostridium sp. A1-XYC3]MDW8800289.1 2-dehydropantoate 2-reductase [Clostridium sp. A1-XYC3]